MSNDNFRNKPFYDMKNGTMIKAEPPKTKWNQIDFQNIQKVFSKTDDGLALIKLRNLIFDAELEGSDANAKFLQALRRVGETCEYCLKD